MSTEPPIKGPLEQHLDPVLDDARIQRIARGVQASRHLPSTRPPWRLLVVGVGVAVAAALAVVVWTSRSAEPLPLVLADGSPLPAHFSAQAAAKQLKLSDGSVMSLEANTAAEVVANQPGKLTMLIRQGRARFEVNPRAQRQWLVEAGLATVEVVGTVFTVDRSADGVSVAVERGIVVVRSDKLPDHLQRLEAGQSTFIREAPAIPAPLAAGRADDAAVMAQQERADPPPVAPVAQGPTQVPRRSPPGPAAWRAAAASGDFARAWSALEARGFGAAVNAATQSEELLALADTARSTGHHAAAAEALKRLLVVAPADVNAATAAFTLGRLELEQLGRPADAAAHFALAAANPSLGPLTEDALARRVEALRAAGRQEEARGAARQTVERFPNGANAAQLQRWLDETSHDGPWPR